MCEFTVYSLTADGKEKVGKDIMYMKYNESTGESMFADILGRPLPIRDAWVTEINMFESRHEISVIRSELVPIFTRLMFELSRKDENAAKSTAEELINSLKKKFDI